jgi:flagellar motor protein MotB
MGAHAWMRCGLMGKSVAAIGLSAAMFLGLTGCQDKVADENQKLWQQNRELQEQNDQLRAQTAMAVAPPQPVAPKPVDIPQPAPAPAPVEPAPAPAPAVHQIAGLETTVDRAAGTTTVHLPSDIFFDSGSAVLRTPGKTSLIKVAAVLKRKYTGKSIDVQGYTDSDPIKLSKWKSNKELSQARAKAVRDFLVAQGVSAEDLEIHGLGDANPRSEKVKSLNRRVELVVASVQ